MSKGGRTEIHPAVLLCFVLGQEITVKYCVGLNVQCSPCLTCLKTWTQLLELFGKVVEPSGGRASVKEVKDPWVDLKVLGFHFLLALFFLCVDECH